MGIVSSWQLRIIRRLIGPRAALHDGEIAIRAADQTHRSLRSVRCRLTPIASRRTADIVGLVLHKRLRGCQEGIVRVFPFEDLSVGALGFS